MKQDSVIVKNEVGLHARPAALIVKEATKYKSKINIIKGENSYNGKSIISVLSMCAIKNDQLTIVAEGEDECEAVSAIKELIANYEE